MGVKALNRGVTIKCIEPIGYTPPEELTNKVPEKIHAGYNKHRKEGSILDRVLPEIDVIIYMNEKEVGVLGFPSVNGSFDYLGFTSKDSSFLKWCMDLHEYYWALGKQRDEFYIE
jgi:predicted transcriptional regulator